jgi:hypothetical protein
MSAVDSARRPVLLVALLLAVVALAAGQEPTVIRVSDAVGDTIDRTERDSFRLFPNTAGFLHATIIELPRPEILADVTLTDGDSTRRVFFQLMPSQLERIRFLVDNRDFVEAQLIADTSAASALATFWLSIEERPLRATSGDPSRDSGAVGAQPATTSFEHRYNYALHGAALGSVAGGCIGARTGYTLVEPGHLEYTDCCAIYVPPLYRVDLPIVLATSIGATALTGAAGYALGAAQDRKPAPSRLEEEGVRWRTGCAGASVLPAVAIGVLAGVVTRGTIFGRENEHHYKIENDPDGWSALPAVLTGICVSVEVVTIGYQIGCAIDRSETERAEAKRRALGR